MLRLISVIKQSQRIQLLLSILVLFIVADVQGQMITGIWKGRIHQQKVELKIIQKGDSLTGTSYYYQSAGHYRRYSIRGYFDATTNETVWWDDQLLEVKQGRNALSQPGKIPLVARADFNCPGDGRMMLDGKAGRQGEENPRGVVDLDKATTTGFPDEWDFVIDNYLVGANDPDIIDSIAGLATAPVIPQKQEVIVATPVKEVTPVVVKQTPIVTPQIIVPVIPKTLTIEEKFTTRKKVFTKEILLEGDSLELRFYDNAEIDGDSISLFLNDKLIFKNIRLLASAYTIKLPIAELEETNELVMVAENLGSIPPNTSYMVALCGTKRYEARLESTEGSSAMIRLVKNKP